LHASSPEKLADSGVFAHNEAVGDRHFHYSGEELVAVRPEINNSILKLSNEHKVFLDVLEKLERILLETDNRKMLADLEACTEHLQEQLAAHFSFEENVLFKAFLVGIPTDRTVEKVLGLVKQHGVMLNHLQYWRGLAAVHHAENSAQIRFQHQMMVHFVDLLKVHVKTEIEEIYPMIAQNPRCLQLIATMTVDT